MAEASTSSPKSAARATTRALPIALLRAREKVMGPVRHMLADAGVTEQQWRVLRVLDERGTTDATEIAKAACLLMPSLTRIVQVLEEKELCSRRPHPTDRRRTLIDISDTGRALLAENMPQANKIYRNIEHGLGRKKMDQLLDLLNELVEIDDI